MGFLRKTIFFLPFRKRVKSSHQKTPSGREGILFVMQFFLQMDDQRPTPAVGMRTGGIETLTGT